MTRLLALVPILLLASVSSSDTATYGWEGTGDVLSTYGDLIYEISTDEVHAGSHSLYIEENASSGTSQAYVAWIQGLQDGDEVTASFWRYDVTPGASPSIRIWGHWNDDPNDVDGYDGSAGGNTDYGPGTGWDETSHTWTVEEGHTGLVVEARIYTAPGDAGYIDDLTVTAPAGCTIITPDDYTAIQSSTWGDIKASF